MFIIRDKARLRRLHIHGFRCNARRKSKLRDLNVSHTFLETIFVSSHLLFLCMHMLSISLSLSLSLSILNLISTFLPLMWTILNMSSTFLNVISHTCNDVGHLVKDQMKNSYLSVYLPLGGHKLRGSLSVWGAKRTRGLRLKLQTSGSQFRSKLSSISIPMTASRTMRVVETNSIPELVPSIGTALLAVIRILAVKTLKSAKGLLKIVLSLAKSLQRLMTISLMLLLVFFCLCCSLCCAIDGAFWHSVQRVRMRPHCPNLPGMGAVRCALAGDITVELRWNFLHTGETLGTPSVGIGITGHTSVGIRGLFIYYESTKRKLNDVL